MKKFFISLINANTGAALDTAMKLEDIDLSFSTYSDAVNTYSVSFSAFADGIYNLITKYIAPNYRKSEDVLQAAIRYPAALGEYFDRVKVKLNSFDSDMFKYEDLKNNLFNLISTTIQPEDFDHNTDVIMYPFIISDYIQELKAQQNAILLSMRNLYTGGNSDV